MTNILVTLRIEDYGPKVPNIKFNNFICLMLNENYIGHIPLSGMQPYECTQEIKELKSDIRYNIRIFTADDNVLIGISEFLLAQSVIEAADENTTVTISKRCKLSIDMKTKIKLFGSVVKTCDLFLDIAAEVYIQGKEKRLKSNKGTYYKKLPMKNKAKIMKKYNTNFVKKTHKLINCCDVNQKTTIREEEGNRGRMRDFSSFNAANKPLHHHKENYSSKFLEKTDLNSYLNTASNEEHIPFPYENYINYANFNSNFETKRQKILYLNSKKCVNKSSDRINKNLCKDNRLKSVRNLSDLSLSNNFLSDISENKTKSIIKKDKFFGKDYKIRSSLSTNFGLKKKVKSKCNFFKKGRDSLISTISTTKNNNEKIVFKFDKTPTEKHKRDISYDIPTNTKSFINSTASQERTELKSSGNKVIKEMIQTEGSKSTNISGVPSNSLHQVTSSFDVNNNKSQVNFSDENIVTKEKMNQTSFGFNKKMRSVNSFDFAKSENDLIDDSLDNLSNNLISTFSKQGFIFNKGLNNCSNQYNTLNAAKPKRHPENIEMIKAETLQTVKNLIDYYTFFNRKIELTKKEIENNKKYMKIEMENVNYTVKKIKIIDKRKNNVEIKNILQGEIKSELNNKLLLKLGKIKKKEFSIFTSSFPTLFPENCLENLIKTEKQNYKEKKNTCDLMLKLAKNLVEKFGNISQVYLDDDFHKRKIKKILEKNKIKENTEEEREVITPEKKVDFVVDLHKEQSAIIQPAFQAFNGSVEKIKIIKEEDEEFESDKSENECKTLHESQKKNKEGNTNKNRGVDSHYRKQWQAFAVNSLRDGLREKVNEKERDISHIREIKENESNIEETQNYSKFSKITMEQNNENTDKIESFDNNSGIKENSKKQIKDYNDINILNELVNLENNKNNICNNNNNNNNINSNNNITFNNLLKSEPNLIKEKENINSNIPSLSKYKFAKAILNTNITSKDDLTNKEDNSNFFSSKVIAQINSTGKKEKSCDSIKKISLERNSSKRNRGMKSNHDTNRKSKNSEYDCSLTNDYEMPSDSSSMMKNFDVACELKPVEIINGLKNINKIQETNIESDDDNIGKRLTYDMIKNDTQNQKMIENVLLRNFYLNYKSINKSKKKFYRLGKNEFIYDEKQVAPYIKEGEIVLITKENEHLSIEEFIEKYNKEFNL